MTQQEKTIENLERENFKLRQQIKLYEDLVKQHEDNQKELLKKIELANALQKSEAA